MGELTGGRPIPSPCNGICKIDDASGWCLGCGRTIDEIVRWGSTHSADRRAVVADLPERMRKLSDL